MKIQVFLILSRKYNLMCMIFLFYGISVVEKKIKSWTTRLVSGICFYCVSYLEMVKEWQTVSSPRMKTSNQNWNPGILPVQSEKLLSASSHWSYAANATSVIEECSWLHWTARVVLTNWWPHHVILVIRLSEARLWKTPSWPWMVVFPNWKAKCKFGSLLIIDRIMPHRREFCLMPI